MNGIINFLNLINENWTSITVIIGLCIMLYKKIKDYISKTDDEKVEIAKKQIKEICLRLVSEAEADYMDWSQAGEIKRAQVIQEIYKQYPVLEKVINQDALINFIDDAIDEALVTLREVIEVNENSFVITTREDN